MIKHENLKRFREHQQQLEAEGYTPVFTSNDGGVLFAHKDSSRIFKFLHNDASVDDWDTDWRVVFTELFEQKPHLLDILLGAVYSLED